MLNDTLLAALNNLDAVRSDLERTNRAREDEKKRAFREKLTHKK